VDETEKKRAKESANMFGVDLDSEETRRMLDKSFKPAMDEVRFQSIVIYHFRSCGRMIYSVS
jgi:hypothetical protein